MADNFNTLYLLSYNNYYNRLVKKLDTLQEYGEYIVDTQQNINFNPADGINTQQVVNSYNSSPDYLIVAKGEEIVSRWFIIEAERLRNGQYQLTLHRDTAVDYYDGIVNAPVFIEKATLDSSDPMIFNKENMSYNQIKTEQTLLREQGVEEDGWIVGYIADDFLNNQDKQVSFEIPQLVNSDLTYEELVAYDNKIFNPTVTMYVGVRYGTFKNYRYSQAVVNNQGQKSFKDRTNTTPYSYTVPFKNSVQLNAIETALNATYREQYSAYIANANIMSYNGKICMRESNNKVYSIKIEKVKHTYQQLSIIGVLGTRYIQEMANLGITATTSAASCIIEGDMYSITLSEVTGATVNATISTTTKRLQDAPYYMFCSRHYKDYSSKILTFINGLSKSLGSALYDVQILPYKPIFDTDDNTQFKYDDGGIQRNYWTIFWCTESSFTATIPYTKTIQDYKIESECDMYRICSPNGAGVFEFNAAKNGGINGFTANCTYKPYNPYINVVPNFSGLYGTNFQDYRGLVCQGDFSLPRVNDQWVEYQLQNKNFQASFDRQIESMELNNKYQKVNDVVNAITGTIQGGITGATAGGMVGGGVGAVAGGIIGTVASAAGGITDVSINEKLRNDALDLTKDQFGYNLGNIQARPNTLSKTGSMNIDNPYIPYLEYYTCTEIEKKALRDKIKYNGMTVMRIGKIADYIKEEPTYIKCKLIRAEEISDDYHLIKSIAEELDKGVFI